MSEQAGSSNANGVNSSSRTTRHRSRKHHEKPSTAEREQKKASRLQTLGPGESIKEKQVRDLGQMWPKSI